MPLTHQLAFRLGILPLPPIVLRTLTKAKVFSHDLRPMLQYCTGSFAKFSMLGRHVDSPADWKDTSWLYIVRYKHILRNRYTSTCVLRRHTRVGTLVEVQHTDTLQHHQLKSFGDIMLSRCKHQGSRLFLCNFPLPIGQRVILYPVVSPFAEIGILARLGA